MDRKEIVKTCLSLMAAAWVMHLRPRLQLQTLGGSPTLVLQVSSVLAASFEAIFLTLSTMLALLMPSHTTGVKWIFAGAFILQCIWCCAESTVLNVVELQTLPSMLAADNYFPIHVKSIMILGMQLLSLIEMAFVLFYTVEYEN